MTNSIRSHESFKTISSPTYHLIFGTLLVTAGLEELGFYFGTNIRPSIGINFACGKISDVVNYTFDYFRPSPPKRQIYATFE